MGSAAMRSRARALTARWLAGCPCHRQWCPRRDSNAFVPSVSGELSASSTLGASRSTAFAVPAMVEVTYSLRVRVSSLTQQAYQDFEGFSGVFDVLPDMLQ